MGSVDIPKQQRAAVKEGSGSDAKAPTKDMPVDMPDANQILVKITWYAHSHILHPFHTLQHLTTTDFHGW